MYGPPIGGMGGIHYSTTTIIQHRKMVVELLASQDTSRHICVTHIKSLGSKEQKSVEFKQQNIYFWYSKWTALYLSKSEMGISTTFYSEVKYASAEFQSKKLKH